MIKPSNMFIDEGKIYPVRINEWFHNFFLLSFYLWGWQALFSDNKLSFRGKTILTKNLALAEIKIDIQNRGQHCYTVL